MADPKNKEEVRSRAAADGIEFFFAQFVDMHGKPSAKLVPAERLDMLFDDGAGFAGFAAGPIGQSPASPDIAAIPDPESYTPVPFKPGLARFACDITIDGAPYNFCPRTILKNATARAEKMGYRLKMGMELEFFLLKERDGKIVLADDLDTLEQPCYDMKGITRSYDFITQLSKNMNGLGWGNYANDHEDANGQFELNFEYDDALRTADKAIFFRYMVHAMAQERGLLTTFMPKPFSNLTGNGGHLHISLWDPTGKINLFEDNQDPRGLGLSTLAYEFLGGIIDNSDGLSAILAPTVNSYKRIGVGAPTSGATWAPAYATYGMNNRTQSIRIPAPGRIEIRSTDGAANPYLAAAAIIGCGLDGVAKKTSPGEPNLDNLYELSPAQIKRKRIKTLPANLLDAVRAAEKNKPLRDWLGEMDGRAYLDYFAEVKLAEWQEYHTTVSDWELRRYLTLF
ncbi:MAG: type III glutamate--ammonia ligase [Thermoleophilia bacterium]